MLYSSQAITLPCTQVVPPLTSNTRKRRPDVPKLLVPFVAWVHGMVVKDRVFPGAYLIVSPRLNLQMRRYRDCGLGNRYLQG
jgi:hypothetical protein